ncbi:PEGA domain-containing protein [Treponema primitia]|nr:PEGA domain-containing protein [Treponema primitia]
MINNLVRDSKFFAVFLFLFVLSVSAWSKGKVEEAVIDPLNPEWALCITALDVSALPPAQKILGELMVRNLAESLADLHHRIRVSEEFAYYKDVAWVRTLGDAGKKLSAKRTERDQLLYKGYPRWRYKNEIKTIDKSIVTLEEEYHQAEEALLEIAPAPSFILTSENTGGTFPTPPSAGGEYRFCVTQKADAFITGEIVEFHGRILLSIRMYTLYTRSFEYEDSFIFSTDDMAQIREELTGRLIAVISGGRSAAIAVKAQPEGAIILVKESFAGQGDTGVMEYPPGPTDVAVFADGYNGAQAMVDLAPGELTELQFSLQPVQETSFEIDLPGNERASIYQGSLYLGTSPLTVTAPLNQFEYIHAETPGGRTSSAIFRAGQTGDMVTLPLPTPQGKDPKPLGTARDRYYGAWTRFWIALPVAFMISGVSSTYENAYIVGKDPDVGNTYQILNAVSIGAWIGLGLITAESFYRIFRYTRTASKSVPALLKK